MALKWLFQGSLKINLRPIKMFKMKNTLLILFLGLASLSSSAQDSARTNSVHNLKTYDELLPRFAIDVNFKYGFVSGSATSVDPSTSYTNVIQSVFAYKAPTISSTNGLGGDFHIGYFFGRKHNWGLSIGLIYSSSQNYNLRMDSLHVEYQSVDSFATHDIFRQIITTKGPVTESVRSSSISIPVLVKFKHQFSRDWGFFAEGGPMVSVMSVNRSTTNAVFDYEAIYQFNSNVEGVYDNRVTPAANDWLITKTAYQHNNRDAGTINNYFTDLNNKGYNVGLNSSPFNKSRTTHYNPFALGGLIQAGFSYQLNYGITANFGGYYSYQIFQNTGNEKYQVTNTVGSYHSMTEGIKQVATQSYGVTVGLRFFIGKPRDVDGDDIPDKIDECPLLFGLVEFNGCPDSDGDGVPDKEDRCPYQKGTKQTAGCPDTDNDGVPDDVDRCAEAPGSWATGGCPDRDNDAVADDDDWCPDEPGIKRYHGCKSDTALKTAALASATGAAPSPVVTYEPAAITLSKNYINFKFKKADIEENNYPLLDEVANYLKKDGKLVIFISGHTDDIGTYQNNMMLSYARAEMVQKYLLYKGVDKNRIIISGMGKADPVIANDKEENRARNRRIEMRLLVPVSK